MGPEPAYIDLLYVDGIDEEVEADIRKHYPDIILKRSYDEIHGCRMEAYGDIPEEDWIRVVFKKGFPSLSFKVMLWCGLPEKKEFLEKMIQETKKKKNT